MHTRVYVARGSEDGVIAAGTNLGRIIDEAEKYIAEANDVPHQFGVDTPYTRKEFTKQVRDNWYGTIYTQSNVSVEVTSYAD